MRMSHRNRGRKSRGRRRDGGGRRARPGDPADHRRSRRGSRKLCGISRAAGASWLLGSPTAWAAAGDPHPAALARSHLLPEEEGEARLRPRCVNLVARKGGRNASPIRAGRGQRPRLQSFTTSKILPRPFSGTPRAAPPWCDSCRSRRDSRKPRPARTGDASNASNTDAADRPS
jgi:hypothetical protein